MLAGDDDVLGVVVTDVEFLDLGDVLPSLGVNRPPVGLHNQFQFLPTGLNRRGQVKGLALEKKRILQNSTILNPGRKIVHHIYDKFLQWKLNVCEKSCVITPNSVANLSFYM